MAALRLVSSEAMLQILEMLGIYRNSDVGAVGHIAETLP